MRRLFLLASLLPALCASAAAPPLQYAALGDLKLHNGEVIRNCRLAYRTYGTLNAARSNAILFPTWFSGRTEDLDAQVTQWFDPARDFVITVDALGNGVSTSPSHGAQRPFPKFDIHDMVYSEYRLATELFGITKLRAVIGISMGGMQTFEWAAAYPSFVEFAVPIVGSPKLASSDILLWSAEAAAIEGQEKPNMRAIAAMHTFALTTPANLARELAAADTPSRITREAAGIARMNATDWLYQLNAMMAQNSFEHSAAARPKMLVVIATQDHMVNPQPARDFATAAAGGVALLELKGDCGHLAPGCEAAALAAAVKGFLR